MLEKRLSSIGQTPNSSGVTVLPFSMELLIDLQNMGHFHSIRPAIYIPENNQIQIFNPACIRAS